MGNRERFTPFTGGKREAIPSLTPPLALVMAQLRWPTLASLTPEALEAGFKEVGAGLEDFPLVERGNEVNLQVSAEGVTQVAGSALFKLTSIDGHWQVSVTGQSVTLSTTRYSDYEDFAAKLSQVFRVVIESLRIPVFQRLGYRYLNRVEGTEDSERVADYFSTELAGIRIPETSNGEVKLVTSVSQAQFQVEENHYLQVRAGHIPSGQSMDAALDPLENDSWGLDLDSFVTFSHEHRTVDELLAKVGVLADTDYDFFRAVITPAYIERYSAQG